MTNDRWNNHYCYFTAVADSGACARACLRARVLSKIAAGLKEITAQNLVLNMTSPINDAATKCVKIINERPGFANKKWTMKTGDEK